jgi:hypothetical protein
MTCRTSRMGSRYAASPTAQTPETTSANIAQVQL